MYKRQGNHKMYHDCTITCSDSTTFSHYRYLDVSHWSSSMIINNTNFKVYVRVSSAFVMCCNELLLSSCLLFFSHFSLTEFNNRSLIIGPSHLIPFSHFMCTIVSFLNKYYTILYPKCLHCILSVSYTHLDVYKRQIL